jgi:hypothetical protein
MLIAFSVDIGADPLYDHASRAVRYLFSCTLRGTDGVRDGSGRMRSRGCCSRGSTANLMRSSCVSLLPFVRG